MKKIPVAVAVIISGNNEILLTRRFDPSSPETHLKWQLPGGGIEKDETAQKACIREAFEETGLTIELLSEAQIITRYYASKNYVLYGFKAKAISDTINTDLDEETAEARWFDRSKIARLKSLDDTAEMIDKCLK